MDGRAWQAPVHGVAKNQTRLSNSQAVFLAFQMEPSAQLSTELRLADSQLCMFHFWLDHKCSHAELNSNCC